MITTEYLYERHRYWAERIGCIGIWDDRKFKPVTIILRPPLKSWLGKFQREVTRSRWLKRKKIIDRIFICQPRDGMTTRQIDEILIHEMIHQYIIQNNIQDTAPHGEIFKQFQNRINLWFRNELKIRISYRITPVKKPGNQIHTLILIYSPKRDWFFCRIKPHKIDWFINYIEENRQALNILTYQVCESDNTYFESLPACLKCLRGRPTFHGDILRFRKEYNVWPRGL